MKKTKISASLVSSTAFADFAREVEALLDVTAKGKGYNQTGTDGPNRLFEFVLTNIGQGEPTHALGEVVYKCQRYARKKNPEDLLKAAAWCYLVWKHR